jgi:apolipoprotein N-acyltransferase
VLLTFSFPRFGHPLVAWVALSPLLVALEGTAGLPPRRPFLLGLVTGFVYFAGTLYWTPDVLRTFGGISAPLALVAGGILVAYLALYPAFFASMTSRIAARAGPGGLLVAPAVWVAMELLRRWVLGGFPWVQLGSSQAGVIPILQTASVAGVYGLSAVIVTVSAALALAVTGRGPVRWAAPAAAALLVGGLAGWGAWRVHDASLMAEGWKLRVALAQGNVPQDEKWDKNRSERILNTYLEQTREGAKQGASLIIWPESSTPFMYEHDAAGQAAIQQTARELGVSLLFGSDQYDPGKPPRYYNSAFLVTPDGRTAAVYRKMHLVPFGEFVPMKRLLFFVAPIVESVSDFSPGEEAVVMPLGANRLSTAICYEVVYPDLIASFVGRGSQLLTTITNDAWYGQSSAPYQHFWMATLRAVEQGRYLVRAANTGISGIVDPYGRVVAMTPLFERTVVTGDVRYLDHRTLYALTGDAFAYACGLVTVLAWFMARPRGTRGGRSR